MSSNEKCGKKTNLLVYQKKTGQKIERKHPCSPRCQKPYRPPICAPKPKQIRVCTGAELKKMCPPKICPCPKDKSSVFLAMLGFLAKTAVAASAVYVSYDLGLWGTTEDTYQLYRAYCNILSEPELERATKWDPPSCDAEKDMFKLPRFNPHGHCDSPPVNFQKQTTAFRSCWNRTVELVFGTLTGFPRNMMTGWSSDDGEQKNVCVKMEVDEDSGVIPGNYKTKK